MLWFKKRKYLILGLAFFAQLFGAGNLLFPSMLGVQSGEWWWVSITGFIVSDTLFALMAFSLMSRNSSIMEFGAPLGKRTMKIFCIAVLFVFAFFIEPRTASMTYELSIKPWVGTHFNPIYFYIMYFALAFILMARASTVAEKLGVYFAPILGLTILIMIIAGIFNIHSMGMLHTSLASSFGKGIGFGYQTGDTLGAIFVVSFVSGLLTTEGVNSEKEKRTVIFKGGIVCIVLFMILYYGLGLLGARISTMVHQDIKPIEVLLYIVQNSLGEFGSIFLSFVVFVVCFSTGMGLLGIISHFIVEHISNRIPYIGWGLICSIIGVVLGYQGVDMIIKLASPVLECLYPMLLTYITLRVINIENLWVLRISSFTAFIFSILGILVSFQVHWAIYMAQYFWMSTSSFIWVFPTVLVAFLSTMGFYGYKSLRRHKQ